MRWNCDDVYCYIGGRLKLERETENSGVCAQKRGSMRAVVPMATPCTGFVIGFSTSHWEEEVVGTRGREEVRERAAVLILERERRWFASKRPRCETKEGREMMRGSAEPETAKTSSGT